MNYRKFEFLLASVLLFLFMLYSSDACAQSVTLQSGMDLDPATPGSCLILRTKNETHLVDGRLVIDETKEEQIGDSDKLNQHLREVQGLIEARFGAGSLRNMFTPLYDRLRSQHRELSILDVSPGPLGVDLNGTPYLQVRPLVETLRRYTDILETVYVEPIPVLASTTGETPDFQPLQAYLGPDGVDAMGAWKFLGDGRGHGDGVRIVDIEYAWNLGHEDLPMTVDSNIGSGFLNRQHGTAVMGVLVARDNHSGMVGLSHRAATYTQTVGSCLPEIIVKAALKATENYPQTRGVVLIEVQQRPAARKTCPGSCLPAQCGFVPVEYWQESRKAIRAAVEIGAVVIEAAGNGSWNLDTALPSADQYDSGAIIVGAGQPHSRRPLCFTNWGSRIDVQAWGSGVVTTGYGNLFHGGNDDNRLYKAGFAGTSSAAAIAAGVVADLIGICQKVILPYDIRRILKDTGIPQSFKRKHIGPSVNLRQAAEAVIAKCATP
ncbi:MAG TPA: S8 family serine peptidase [Thermoanaerobaculia bacterium]|nr:S8 family serine peptidase [Thermoanaerobaculia bacterium]